MTRLVKTAKGLGKLILALIGGGFFPLLLFLYYGTHFNSSIPPGHILLFSAVSLGSWFLVAFGNRFLSKRSFKILALAGWAALVFAFGALEIHHFIREPVRFIAGQPAVDQYSRATSAPVSGLRVELGAETRAGIGLYPETSIQKALEITSGSFLTYGAAMIASPQDPRAVLLQVLVRDASGQMQKLEQLKFEGGTTAWSDHVLDFSSRAGQRVEVIFRAVALGSAPPAGSKPPLILVSNPRLIPADPRRPNIILIVADSWRADHTSLSSPSPDLTPRLAELAGQGVTFARHRAQSSCTMISTPSFLTGTLPIQTGVSSYRFSLPGSNDVIAEFFNRAGWQTAAFSANALINPDLNFDQGFDSYHMSLPFPPYCWRNGEILTAPAKTWIQAHHQLPFFLFLFYVDPHYPYFPPLDYISFRGPEKIGWMDFFKILIWQGPFNFLTVPRPDLVKAHHSLYRGEIRYFDYWLGQIIDELKKQGLLDNTIIMVTSDHGEEFLDHGLLGHGTSLYDELLLVPLVIYDGRNKIAGGRTITTETSHLDLLPTMLELAGLPAPATLLGRSLRPASFKSTALPEPNIFAELPQLMDYGHFMGRARKGLANSYLRTMIQYPIKIVTATDLKTHGVVVEIYDLRNDPQEKNNLALSRREEYEPYLEEMNSFFANLPAAIPVDETHRLPQESVRLLKSLGYLH